MKIKNKKKIILLMILVTFLLIPTTKAAVEQINAGYYFTAWNTGDDCIGITAIWTVNSGPAIDVFLFTPEQYNAWKVDPSSPPPGAKYMYLGSNGGSYTEGLTPGITYYAVFSNVNGASASYVDINIQFQHQPNNDTLWLLISLILIATGLIALGIILQYRKKRSITVETEKTAKATLNEQQSQAIHAELMFCTECGFRNVGIAKFCKKCGAKID